MNTKQSDKLSWIFSVPVMQYYIADHLEMDKGLKEAIFSKMKESEGVQVSNSGGWHSTKDLHEWPTEASAALKKHIQLLLTQMIRDTVKDAKEEHFQNWEIEAWANVNKSGDYNYPHNHTKGGALWSGIYYLEPGDSKRGGRTKFEDRSGVAKEILNNSDPYEREHAITPQRGLMVLFPATLWHYVEKYQGSEERITIAFNGFHSGFTIPHYPSVNDYVGWKTMEWLWRYFGGVMRVASKMKRKIKPPVRNL